MIDSRVQPNPLSSRQMARPLKKFKINDGDILAVKFKSPNANQTAIEAVIAALDKMGLKDVLVIVVDDFNDLSVLNETEMNKQGWYKLSSLAKFTRIPKGGMQ